MHMDQHRKKRLKTTLGPVNEYFVIAWPKAVKSYELEKQLWSKSCAESNCPPCLRDISSYIPPYLRCCNSLFLCAAELAGWNYFSAVISQKALSKDFLNQLSITEHSSTTVWDGHIKTVSVINGLQCQLSIINLLKSHSNQVYETHNACFSNMIFSFKQQTGLLLQSQITSIIQ